MSDVLALGKKKLLYFNVKKMLFTTKIGQVAKGLMLKSKEYKLKPKCKTQALLFFKISNKSFSIKKVKLNSPLQKVIRSYEALVLFCIYEEAWCPLEAVACLLLCICEIERA